jgi:phosphate-selective porin OprO/OprP
MQGRAAIAVLAGLGLAAQAHAASSGDVTVAIHGLAQFDAAGYFQSDSAHLLPAAYGPDLSDGSNFRRAYLGVQGKAFSVWSYNLNFDFGGSAGTEKDGHIQSAYVQYDGAAPFAFRVGAFPPAAGLEDSTAPQDTLFLERAAASDVMRNTAAGDGRDGASIVYAGERLFAALSFTGGKVGDSAVFGEQTALVGRAAGIAYRDENALIVLSGSVTHVLRGAGAAAGPGAAHTLALSAAPELTVDSTGTKLVTTGTLNIDSATEWGVETGAEWKNLYAQGGYFHYAVAKHAAPDLAFSGWYAQASWLLTGERRGYKTSSAAFTAPEVEKNSALENGGIGAWELAARYSDLDLNDRAGIAGSATPAGGIRGGEQKIWTAGLNWYPDSFVRFALDYQRVRIDRLASAAPFSSVGQQYNALSARAQFSF